MPGDIGSWEFFGQQRPIASFSQSSFASVPAMPSVPQVDFSSMATLDMSSFYETLANAMERARSVPQAFDADAWSQFIEDGSKATFTFSKPDGISGLPGTRGAAPYGLQPGFWTLLQGAIAEAKRLGAGVSIGEGWRSYEQQVRLKRQKPNLAATPGRSNHGWGLAADLVFRDSRSRQIFHSIVSRWGLWFPMSYEPWHVEPVGLARASSRSVRPQPAPSVPARPSSAGSAMPRRTHQYIR